MPLGPEIVASEVFIDKAEMLTVCLGKDKAQELGDAILANCPKEVKNIAR